MTAPPQPPEQPQARTPKPAADADDLDHEELDGALRTKLETRQAFSPDVVEILTGRRTFPTASDADLALIAALRVPSNTTFTEDEVRAILRLFEHGELEAREAEGAEQGDRYFIALWDEATAHPAAAPEPWSHVWRSADTDFPVQPTGQEHRGSDGRIYVRVFTHYGTENYIPKDEIHEGITPAAMPIAIEVTALTKHGGPLTKRISLAPDGKLHSDGSACLMADGSARRARFDSVSAFAAFITGMRSCEALALGALRPDLPDTVHVVTKRQHGKLNGAHDASVITRTHEHISYRPQQPALALVDIDTKGMPNAVAERIKALGGFWPALVHAAPALADASRVVRRSTSAGIVRRDTGECVVGSDGHHVYLLVEDGSDIERFLRTLHDRCWLAGLGWLTVGAAGQLLNRSLVDRMVFAPERLVFEGRPILLPPLTQDAAARRAVATDGPALDTVTACPPLRIVEQSRLAELRAAEEHRLAPERALAREAFITEQTERIVQRTGISHARARHTAERLSAGILLTHVVLPFDADELAGSTVGDVLDDPDRFTGATLADPLEGAAYGISKARIMRRADGTLWIHSFAHGRTVYELRHDADAATARLDGVPTEQLVTTFIRIALTSDLTPTEYEVLRNTVAKRAGIGRRTLEQTLRQAREQQQRQRETERRTRAAAGRHDRRPRVLRPLPDEPWLPQMMVVNDVLSAASSLRQPRRDIDDEITRRRLLSLPQMHLLTAATAEPTGVRSSKP